MEIVNVMDGMMMITIIDMRIESSDSVDFLFSVVTQIWPHWWSTCKHDW